ncbi:DUF2812 domain-containing protein [Bacillus sp. DJP31]|uniref:DUF2812 domain-containing protein n=1 Tax=Bacillus sp. DJP31 TaxID=3409789 RepID=UPI003BB54EB3
MVLIYLSCIAVINLSFIIPTVFLDVPVTVVESPLWIVTYTVLGMAIALYILAIYSVSKLYKTNKNLNDEKQTKLQSSNQEEGKLKKEQEKNLKRSGKIVMKRKFGWMYGPDKLEEWLEKMEQQGFNLHRVSKTGTVFFFYLGHPRKVSYAADYQNISDEGYFELHREAGWKSIFISMGSLQKWTIWSQEYTEGSEKPHFYGDKIFHLKHARRVALAYTLLFLPFVMMYVLNIGISIERMLIQSTRLSILNAFMLEFVLSFLVHL